jgi:limonene 1,2-monooxygenase
MTTPNMRFGAFIAPVHAFDQHPTLQLEQDLELIQLMDRMGYDEVWIGEHHSGGTEIISSPEVFIMAAAERTKRIRFGTGVCSLPYHHPYMLADRINLLDHLSRGRLIFGVGPGALASDAVMMGIPVEELRDRMDDALAVLIPLLEGKIVNASTSWFQLKDARLQMAPFTRPRVEIAVASLISPTGPIAAGKNGLSLLSIGASQPKAFNTLAANWAMAEEAAAESGKVIDRSAWRLTAPMHIASTRQQARENVKFGIEKWLQYFKDTTGVLFVPADTKDPIDALIETGLAVIGTPDDAVNQIRRLQEATGGFGCMLLMHHEWARPRETLESYDLFARYVIPEINGLNTSRIESFNYLKDNRLEFSARVSTSVGKRIEEYVAAKGELGRSRFGEGVLAAFVDDKSSDPSKVELRRQYAGLKPDVK